MFAHSHLNQRGAIALPPWFFSWVFPVALFFTALILYMRTMCPAIYPGDGAELTAAAWCLGVPHPTGYPLYMVLGFLFQRIGLGTPAFSINLLTALFGALAAVGAYRLQREFWRILFGIHTARLPAFRFAAAALALALALSATWWDQSTQTEVYTLLLAFVAFAWAMALRLIRRPTRNGLLGLALLSGFAMLHHMLFIVTFPLSALAVLQWCIKGRKSRKKAASPALSSVPEETPPASAHKKISPFWPSLALALLLFLLPLLGYLYLPLRAASSPPVNWGNPRGLQGILWHLSGQQYASTKILAHPSGEKLAPDEVPAHAARRLRELGRWLATQYAPHDANRPHRGPMLALVVLLCAALGVFMLWRHSPFAAVGIFASIALNLLLVLLYTIPDIQAYQLPLLLLIGCLAAAGPVAVAQLLAPRPSEAGRPDFRWSRRAGIIGTLALALAVFGAVNWLPPARGINKSQSGEAYEYGETLLRILPPHSIIFTFADYDIFPLWYLQVCEKRRPDIAVLGANFVLNGWYAQQLRATLPPGLRVFLGNEPPGQKDRWLTAFLGGMVAPALQTGRPVYLTFRDPDIAGYFSLQRRFVVPFPANSQVLQMLGESAPGTGTPPAPVPAMQPPLPIFELTDPAQSAAALHQRFMAEFPPSARQAAQRQKPPVSSENTK